MKNLNRKVHPTYHSIKEINIPTPEISYLGLNFIHLMQEHKML